MAEVMRVDNDGVSARECGNTVDNRMETMFTQPMTTTTYNCDYCGPVPYADRIPHMGRRCYANDDEPTTGYVIRYEDGTEATEWITGTDPQEFEAIMLPHYENGGTLVNIVIPVESP